VKSRFDPLPGLTPVNWRLPQSLDRAAKISLNNPFPASLSAQSPLVQGSEVSSDFFATILYREGTARNEEK
jgi:hypothetical protein